MTATLARSVGSACRQFLQMVVGGLPHTTLLKAVELLATEVLPRVRKELGDG